MSKHTPKSEFKTPATRTGWRNLLAAAAVAFFASISPAAMAGVDEEHAAVLATMDSWAEGWATMDAALAVRDYADEPDWTNAFGDRFTSRDELQEGLEFIFSLDFVMAGDSEGAEYEDVRFLSDSVALVRSKLARKGQQFQNGETRPDRHIHHLRVLEKRDGKWVIVSHLISQAQEKR